MQICSPMAYTRSNTSAILQFLQPCSHFSTVPSHSPAKSKMIMRALFITENRDMEFSQVAMCIHVKKNEYMIAFITHGSLIFFCFSLTYLTVTNLSWQPTKYHLAFYFWEIRSPWIFACSPRACPRSNFSTAPSPFLVPNCFTVTCLLPAYTALAMFHSLSPRLLYFCRRPPVARTRC